MDNIVHTFNDELQSLLLSKPPVSKAKMGLITKAAMKGVKFYKHIVQIVEKFIARCRPEYKVPGLYVIDSIVRQSRHQFGPDRDVYAARFARNLGITFENLFADVLDDDRSRMVRVLNLWLKNGVFDMQTIRPLLDMADPNKASSFQGDPKSPSSGETNDSSKQDFATRQRYGSSGVASGDKTLKFNKTMLDFDYGEEDDDDADETPTEAEPPLSSTLSKIEMEQRLKKASSTNENSSSSSSEARVSMVRSSGGSMSTNQASHTKSTTKPSQQQQQPNQDPVLERWNRIIKGEFTNDQASFSTNDHQVHRRSRSRSPPSSGGDKALPHQGNQSQYSTTTTKSTDRRTTNVVATTRESSSSQQGQSGRDSSKTIINPERAAERERKCLPKIRDKHLTICSSTLWLGHVPKTVSEADISDAFGEFGTINSIDLIPPRGCAYVCMDRRQDAKRALGQSKRLKLNGSHFRMAWAPGKGLKEQKQWKDFWESDLGASFVPYSKIDVNSLDFDALEEGGVIDEDSMSMEMREKRDGKLSDGGGQLSTNNNNESSGQISSSNTDERSTTTTLPLFNQPPPSSSANLPSFIIPPPPLNLGMVPPPILLAQGLMRFPPPGVTLASSHLQPLLSTNANNSSDSSEPRDQESFSIPERKVSMVEQHLNMLHQAQGINQQLQLGPPHQSLFYQLNQPDPMAFDFRHAQPQMMHMIPNMIDPNQLAMFDGQQQQQQQQQLLLPFNHHPQLSSMEDAAYNMAQQHEDF
uniref:Splicing factor, arginine/serine-rich 15 n=1 Tax=Aceria tosichella TaxID=561515 RepID=A0A6G1S8G2_9ACAR